MRVNLFQMALGLFKLPNQFNMVGNSDELTVNHPSGFKLWMGGQGMLTLTYGQYRFQCTLPNQEVANLIANAVADSFDIEGEFDHPHFIQYTIPALVEAGMNDFNHTRVVT